jgi:hypothetical protein
VNNLGGLDSSTFRQSVAIGWKQRKPESPLTWLPKNIRFPEGWETTRFDFDDAPHVRGVIELGILNPDVRHIILVWATRLCKTTTVEGLAAWKACEDPVPMAALFPDNEQLDQVDDHLYEMFENCAVLAPQLPPRHERNKKVIRLANCRIRLASGGKKSSVSGYPARWIFKFERDKIGTRKSSEADPDKRIDSRASGFRRDVKIIGEGTPAKRSVSRAAKDLESPDNQKATFWVRCPICKKFQTLTHDNIEWEKSETGHSEPARAEATAWYKCGHNGCRIENHHRRAMMQTGKWVIEGQTIDDKGNVKGSPAVDSDTIVFGPLSKLYSLLISGWGVIASALVKARHAYALGNEELIEKLYSEDLAIPWDPLRRKVRTHDLANRFKADDHEARGVIPEWASFLTFTNDVGMIQSEHVFYGMVTAWGEQARGAVIDWGIWTSIDLFLSEWRAASYQTADGKTIALWGQPASIDAGTYQEEICALVRGIKNCYPSKGDTKRNSGNGELYYPGFQRVGLSPRQLELKRKAAQYDLLWIGSQATQQWRVALIEGRIKQTTPGFVSLPADVLEAWEDHEDFLDELTADQYIEGRWVGENNEFGDCLRYARALAECVTKNGTRWGKIPKLSGAKTGSGQKLFSRSAGSGASKPFIQGFN